MNGVIEVYINNSDGNPNVLNSNRNDGKSWVNANWDNPNDNWDDDGAFAFLQIISLIKIKTHNYVFLFSVCPSHPPSILPISSIGKDNSSYFLVSIDLVSHNTKSKIFKVSSFLIAVLKYGILSSLFTKLALETISIISINKLSILIARVYR